MSYDFLWQIALILVSTKVCGLITRRFQMPQVVGALLAGLLLGPAVFGLLPSDSEMIKQLAELGVIVIMFSAGMETDIRDLKNAGKSGFLVAILGVLVPLFGGAGLAAWLAGSHREHAAELLHRHRADRHFREHHGGGPA